MCKSCNYSRREVQFGGKSWHLQDTILFSNGAEYTLTAVMPFDDPEMWLLPKDYKFDRDTVGDATLTIRESAYLEATK